MTSLTKNERVNLPLEGLTQAFAHVYAETYAASRGIHKYQDGAARVEAAKAVRDFAALLHVEV